jgi:hypothetical protein
MERLFPVNDNTTISACSKGNFCETNNIRIDKYRQQIQKVIGKGDNITLSEDTEWLNNVYLPNKKKPNKTNKRNTSNSFNESTFILFFAHKK